MALESCEFWSAFCEAAVSPDVLRPFLPQLVPVLLKNMVYDEYDEEVADAEAAEEAPGQEDSEQEIKPFISRWVGLGEVGWAGRSVATGEQRGSSGEVRKQIVERVLLSVVCGSLIAVGRRFWWHSVAGQQVAVHTQREEVGLCIALRAHIFGSKHWHKRFGD